jgi:hypothetical protein
MSHSGRVSIANNLIRQLASKHLPSLLELEGNKLAIELAKPETGQFKKRIDRYRRTGRRRFERQDIEPALFDISREEIARRLKVHVSSVSRWLNGNTCSDNLDQIFVEFAEQLRSIRHPTENECTIAGYCHAMEKLRRDVARAVGKKLSSKPELTPENFCYLWVQLSEESWQKAMMETDAACKKELLEAAATRLYEKVKDPCRFPSWPNALRKPHETISSIYKKWGLWYCFVVLAAADVSVLRSFNHLKSRGP